MSTNPNVPRSGSYKTVCVRTCDGYHFPVSNSLNRTQMGRDLAVCNTLCPGRNMELYYHPKGDESGQNLRSRTTNAPYSNLPNAFAYRQQYNPACACNFNLLKAEPKVDPSKRELRDRMVRIQELARIATPVWRVDPLADAETIANARSGLDMETIRELASPKADITASDKRRPVRIIGDAYFPPL